MTYAPDQPTGNAVPDEEGGSRRNLGCLLEIVETLVLTLLIYLLIHNFIAQPFEVEQTSMEPTIEEHEYVLIDKITPRFDTFHRGDIIVFDPPPGYEQGGVPFIKRVIGIPGDTVTLRNGSVYVTPAGGSAVKLDEPYVASNPDGSPQPTKCKDVECTDSWTVPAGMYFVLGDHREISQDSRFFGPINRDLIVGRAWLRYFPLDRIGILQRPTYPGLEDQASSSVTGPRGAGAYPALGSSATTQASIALG